MPVKKFLKAAKDIEDGFRKKEEKKHEVAHDDESNWLVSYADMMTLLCGFFIMMFAMSKPDQPQFEKVAEALAKQFGGDYKSPTKEFARFVTQVLHEAGVDGEASVKSDPAGVSVVFKSTLFFDSLSSDVKTPGKAILDKLIAAIAERQKMELKKYKVVIEGHTDSRPVVGGVYPSNWELSGARAARVVRMFLETGFTPDHMTAIGYADTHPEVPMRKSSGEWDEEGLAKNRRVVVRIMEPQVDYIPFPEAPDASPPAKEASAPAETARAPAETPPAAK